MKNALLVLLIITGGCYLGQAQDDKVKGDRNVTVKQTYVNEFTGLVVNNDFEVDIVFNSKPSVEIEADDNLHEVIQFDVNNGILTFTAGKRITSKRKLHITVNYSVPLTFIEVNESAELRSLTSLELGDLELKTTGNSRTYLNVNAKQFSYNAIDKSRMRLNLTADSTAFILSDDVKVDALVNSKITKFDLYQDADATIEGTVGAGELRLDNSSNFNGKNFTLKTANLLVEGNSDLSIMVTEDVVLSASGGSEVYLYGEPKITLQKFTGTAKLQKKEL